MINNHDMTTPTELLGLSLLGFARGGRQERTFHAVDPATGGRLGPPFHTAEPEEVELACRMAHEAAEPYGETQPAERAAFLRALSQGLEAAREPIVARGQSETGLPAARLQSELGRTCGQLRLFADLVEEGSWVDARIDTADPTRQPVPKPDVR